MRFAEERARGAAVPATRVLSSMPALFPTWALFVVAALLGAACNGSQGPAERSLRRLERLAFVPAGECVLPRGGKPRAGVDCSNPAPLLFDRFEVTREEWLEFVGDQPAGDLPPVALAHWRGWGSDGPDRPASWMTPAEARRLAAREGMRLPTAAEWMRVAAGTRAQRFPWGQAARSVSNSLDLRLGRTTAVGTFEHGGTLLGVQDLVGNVSEWVEGYLLEDQHPGDERVWAMGGSYLSHERELYSPSDSALGRLEYNALLFGPDSRSRAVGMRLCAGAAEFLMANAPRWRNNERTRVRLRAVGARWGRAAVPLLEELAARPGAPGTLRALLEGARR